MPTSFSMLLIRGAVVWMASFCLGFGALDFDTYQIRKQIFRVTHNDTVSDSTSISYDLTRLGSTSLEASSITLTSHGSYLAVVEEGTLSGNVENRPHDITKDFLLQGSLPIPPLASVHSLSVMHGDTLFQGSLRRQVYSLDDAFFDTTALKATLDARVVFLQQLTDVSFEATFSKLSLGEPVRVRIEYEIPFPGGPGATVRIPVLFHPSGRTPSQSQITFFEAANNYPALQWLSPNGRVTLDTSGTHTVQYQSEFYFRCDEDPKTVATLQTSTFESGKFKGNYTLFKGSLNDSLMKLLSRPLEVTFLWRWNPPYDFVVMENGLKTLSTLGKLVASEAKTLKQIISEMSPRGHRFGLYRTAPGYSDVFYPPGEAGGSGYDSLMAYLDQFTEEKLYSAYKDYKDDNLAWGPTIWTDSGAIVKSRNDFLNALGIIRKGFSGRAEALQHIELVGFGSAPSTLVDLKDPKTIEAVIDTVTIANAGAAWLGIDMGQALSVKSKDSLRPLQVTSLPLQDIGPLLFPVFEPTSVEYRAFTATRSHVVVLPFSLSAEREAMIKGESPFGDTLQLQGIDALGRKTRIYTLNPRFLRTESDSGLARLWAADPDRIFETSEVDVGMRYGILTKGTYWGAGVFDATLDGVPSATPILARVVHIRSGQTFRMERGFLRIDPGTWASSRTPRLDIYDMRGRLLLSLSLDEFRDAMGYAIPIDVLNRLRQSRVVLRLKGAGNSPSFVLNLGGR